MKLFIDAPSRSFHSWSQRCIPMYTVQEYLSNDMLFLPPLQGLLLYISFTISLFFPGAFKVKYKAEQLSTALILKEIYTQHNGSNLSMQI